MRFTWDESKRRSNLRKHGLDFRDAPAVFEGPTITVVDDRFPYREERFVTLGFHGQLPVSIIHTEHEDQIRIISFRTATKAEVERFLRQVAH